MPPLIPETLFLRVVISNNVLLICKMASNSPNELSRNGFAQQSDTLPLPVTPQPSARNPPRLSSDAFSTHQAVNTTTHHPNSSRSSFGSSTPLLQRQQSAQSARTSYVQGQNTELRPIT